MKFSESWLREWVNPSLTLEQLGEKLTMAGLEIESLSPVAEHFSGVVIGHTIRVEKHPEAERLHICEVDVGKTKTLTIVCAATNVKANMKVPVALEKAKLANNLTIGISKLRGVTSEGMLCSAKDLGLAEESSGLMVFPQDAPLGKDVWEYLKLADYVLDVSITPNRGDCLSRLGMATEVSALTESELCLPEIKAVPAAIQDVIPVTITAKADCPCYVGRVIRQVKADVATPLWLQENLRRSGLRSISAIVDVMNYVMLELGQPMHAFDLAAIQTGIQVRAAHKNETLKLLDGSDVNLHVETTIIADQKNPLAIAGVMGGLDSGVTLLTQDIFLESAYFKPECIARAARRYHLGSDSSYRFERGIDPTLQRLAIERATQLLLGIVGGQPGPVIEVREEKDLPQPVTIVLRVSRIEKMLGCVIADEVVESILQRLGFDVQKSYDALGWLVTVPARRSDITLEEDLIEEVARLYGYDNIPNNSPKAVLNVIPCPENQVSTAALRHGLCNMGYQEVITYTFIDKKLQTLFAPDQAAKELVNPITAEMDVMRTSLWPSLVSALLYNQNRQQTRARLFETGLRFLPQKNELLQQRMLSGLVSGSAAPEQWGAPTRAVDFFDLKGDLQNLLKLTFAADEFYFKPGMHPALHPGQTADIYRNGEWVGVMGALHPTLMQELKLDTKVYLFELLLEKLELARLPRSLGLSKFPEIRRDLALVLDQAIPTAQIQATIGEVAGELLQAVNIFDVYQGKGIEPGRKSIALALTLQHASRTLVDEEVAALLERVVVTLKAQFNAELRG